MRNYPVELRRDSDTKMTLDTTRLLLAFKEPYALEDLSLPLRHLGLALEEGDREETGSFPREAINHTDRRFWIRTSGGEAIDGKLYADIEETFGEQLDWIGPVYQIAYTLGREGLLCPLPNVVLIKAKQDHMADVSPVMRRFALKEDQRKSRYLRGYRYYVVDNPQDNPSYQIQRQLLERESHLVEQVVLENMPMIVPLSVTPSDPLYATQWNMDRIQAGGPGVTGWNLSMGDQFITVCIIDSGCDLTHPDLFFLHHGWDLGTLFGTGAPNPSAPGFAIGHGTAVAGIAAATTNNLKGVAGVAGFCTIFPLAFKNFTEVELWNGIAIAVQKGVRVINMSFNSTAWDTGIINDAIEYAYDSNVIMCASTGNTNGPLGYPSTDPRVIACGASTRTLPEQRAGFSNFGSGISVVAPGVDVPTTDILGSGGFDPATDYVSNFWGTSAAAPHVSGLAALLLSQDPTLSSDKVRDIIEQTADKVGPVPYAPFHPNGSWNRFMGYGRINVLRALQMVS